MVSPTPPPRQPLGYLAEIDGLRAIAVLAVVAFHADLLVGGYLGVDLFFVVSGFLITRLLLVELTSTGTVNLTRFWSRRIKRLLPSALATVMLTIGLVSVFGEPAEARATAKLGFASVFSLANWHLVLNDSSYWNRFGAPPPLTHFWSLSLEEQFYLGWPIVLVCLMGLLRVRRNPLGDRALSRLVAAVAGLCALVSWNLPQTLALRGQVDRIYLGTDTRIASMLVGCAAAALGLGRRHERFRVGPVSGADVAGAAVVAALVWMYLRVPYTENWLYPAGMALQSLMVVTLMICALTEGSWLGKVLSFQPLVTLGRYSYTLYLVHLPIFWLLKTVQPDIRPTQVFSVGLGVSLVIAVLLSVAVEQRFRTVSFTLPQGIATSGGAFAACLAAVLVALQLAPVTATSATDIPGELAMTADGEVASVAGQLNGSIVTSADLTLRRVVVSGDSVAGNIATGLVRIAAGRFAVVDQHRDGCGLIDATRRKAGYGENRALTPLVTPAYCRELLIDLADAIRRDDVAGVVWHARADIDESEIDGKWLNPCDPEFRPLFNQQFARLVDLVAPSNSRSLVMVVPLVDAPEERKGTCLRNLVIEAARARPFVAIVDLQDQYCPDMRCGGNIDGVERFTDAVHLSVASQLDFARNIVTKVPLGARGDASSGSPGRAGFVGSACQRSTLAAVAVDVLAASGCSLRGEQCRSAPDRRTG
jgi:peptidoglycan/LPS O-acetylase OafA/YrhL